MISYQCQREINCGSHSSIKTEQCRPAPPQCRPHSLESCRGLQTFPGLLELSIRSCEECHDVYLRVVIFPPLQLWRPWHRQPVSLHNKNGFNEAVRVLMSNIMNYFHQNISENITSYNNISIEISDSNVTSYFFLNNLWGKYSLSAIKIYAREI